MARITRRAVIGALLAGGGLIGLGLASSYLLADIIRRAGQSASAGRSTGRMMGSATSADMSTYMDLFSRHAELRRTVDEVPGGIRTTTESNSPKLTAQLQAHVSSMYSHLNQRTEVTCMSDSLPTLFQGASGYSRQLALTPKGVTVTETSSDPALTRTIREHAQEVSGFVRDGMPAMMRGMLGG